VFHPDLVPWKLHDSGIEWVALWEITSAMVANGEADANVYSSREILGETDAA
jgi:hypothetical protein